MNNSQQQHTADDNLRQVQTIKKQNDEIIKHINGVKVVNRFHYNITQSMVNKCFKFDVTEKQVEESGSSIINSWTLSISMIVIPDIFNDKINYSCSKFSDLVRLNNEMHVVIQKYELFGDSERARQETQKFLENFRLIQKQLKLIEASLTHEISKLEELKNKLNDINSQFENLMHDHDVTFVLDNGIPKGQVKCYQCGAKPTTMIYYKNDGEPTRHDEFRNNGYSAVCVNHSAAATQRNWILVGQY